HTRPPTSPPSPYTTLFRSYRHADSARMYGLEALQMLSPEAIAQRYEVLHNIAITYQVQSRYEEALKYSKESLHLAETFSDSTEKDRKSTRLNSSHVKSSYA